MTPGVSKRYGREAAGTGREAQNGFMGTSAAATFQITNKSGDFIKVDPWKTPNTPSSGLLPNIEGVLGVDSPPIGSADGRSQCFNFRMTITSDRSRKVNFPATQPPGYDPLDYEPMLRRLAIDPTLALGDLFIFNKVESGNVFDLNAMGAWSSDLPGASTGYLQMTYAEREARWKRIWNYHLGLWWTFQYSTDPRVPSAVRASALNYGFDMLHYNAPHPKDKLNETPALYVREGYRMEGDQVFDCDYFRGVDGTTPGSTKTIATASYTSTAMTAPRGLASIRMEAGRSGQTVRSASPTQAAMIAFRRFRMRRIFRSAPSARTCAKFSAAPTPTSAPPPSAWSLR